MSGTWTGAFQVKPQPWCLMPIQAAPLEITLGCHRVPLVVENFVRKRSFRRTVVEAGFVVLQLSARSAFALLLAFHTTLSTCRSCRRFATFRPKLLTIKHAHCVEPSTRVAPIRRAARIGSVEAPLKLDFEHAAPLALSFPAPSAVKMGSKNALFLNRAFLAHWALRGTARPQTSRSSMGVDENEA
jgi:hypothetical protein